MWRWTITIKIENVEKEKKNNKTKHQADADGLNKQIDQDFVALSHRLLWKFAKFCYLRL